MASRPLGLPHKLTCWLTIGTLSPESVEMPETIKRLNEALNYGITSTFITNGKEVLHQESDDLGVRSTAHVCDCETDDVAVMIATALNRPSQQDEDLRQSMITASGMVEAD